MRRVDGNVFDVRQDPTRLEEVAFLQFRGWLPEDDLVLRGHSQRKAQAKHLLNFEVLP